MTRPFCNIALVLGVLASVLSGTAFAQSEAGPGAQAALATVNGEPIYPADAERLLASLHENVAAADRSGLNLDRLMFRLVNDLLLAQEARALEMHLEEPVASKVAERRRRLARRYLERVEIDDQAVPTPDEVRAAFEDQYRRVTFRVLTGYEPADAEALKARLEAGADLAELAREASVDPYRLRGGLVDDIVNIDLQRSIADLVFSLEPGEIGGPVQTDLGWSVVVVESFKSADPERFSALEGKLTSLVRQRKAMARRASLARELEAAHRVEVDTEAVARIVPERLPDARLIPTVDEPQAAIVTVDDVVRVTAEEYGQALLARWRGVRNEAAARAAAPIILRRQVDESLLMAEAERRGYLDLPAVTRAVQSYETRLLTERFLEEVIGAGITVSEEEKAEYYQAHKQEFHRPPRVRLGQISVATQDEAERIAALLADGSDLAWLAERHSLDEYKVRGGDRGWTTAQADTSDFRSALFDAEVGEVLEPFEVLGGRYVVLQVLGREEQGIYDLEEISGNVREKVFAEKFREVLDQYITRLRARSEIVVEEELLRTLTVTADVDQAQSDEEGGSEHHQ